MKIKFIGELIAKSANQKKWLSFYEWLMFFLAGAVKDGTIEEKDLQDYITIAFIANKP